MKKNILQLITSSDPGGAQEHVYQLVNFLNKDKYKLAVMARPHNGEGNLSDRLSGMSVNFVPFPELKQEINISYDLLAIRKLVKYIKENNVHLIHCHSSKAGVVGRVAAKICGIPALYTAHGFVFTDENLPLFKRFIYTWVERLMGSLSEKIITVSQWDFSQGILRRIAPEDKMAVIVNGIHVEKYTHKNPLAKGKKSKEKIIIGTVTRLVKEKGLEYLLHGLKTLVEEGYPVELLIAGDGPLLDELMALSYKLNIYEHVKFLGYTDDIPEFLKGIDIFVMSSVKEGMPMALLEAMASGKPIVASAAGGIAEALKPCSTTGREYGILVEVRNHTQLTQGIKKIIKDKEYAVALSANAQAKVLEQYSSRSMVEKVDHMYEGILS